jgi:hypothetical protein
MGYLITFFVKFGGLEKGWGFVFQNLLFLKVKCLFQAKEMNASLFCSVTS